MASRDLVARALANAFLAGDWSRRGLLRRGKLALGGDPVWLHPLAIETLRMFPSAPSDERDVLAACILVSETLTGLVPNELPRIRRFFADRPAMGRGRWSVPEIATSADLARFLDLSIRELDRFADVRAVERDTTHEAVRHYRYRLMPKPGGGARLIEAPKPKLKAIQRRLLRDIVNRIDTHPAAHGFVRGRSVLSFASAHATRRAVLRVDLEDFFGSVSAARVFGVFRNAGYPEIVARALTALCTNRAPARLLDGLPSVTTSEAIQARHRLRGHLRTPHLPQGAPTSPALANACAFGLDVRLSALAASAGATYTRYADDLAFSSDYPAALRAMLETVRYIVRDAGFRVRSDKTRFMTQAVRQVLAGVVVNQGLSIARDEIERLEAILYNAVRYGGVSANREGMAAFRQHLRGRIEWVKSVRPARARKLENLFAEIVW